MNNLKNYEKAVFALREIYLSYGYLPYKMSKFEEYDLYLKNKEFLVSDRVITFTDTNGKLLALKPDVTLSILKNASGEKQKVCYSLNKTLRHPMKFFVFYSLYFYAICIGMVAQWSNELIWYLLMNCSNFKFII